ncbi:hypothetical protein F183_A03410 [Bryobacterales bacterium F-183]|nr:hypothetical protein F183_A03410 [Bryobacterales bacterium F-183]
MIVRAFWAVGMVVWFFLALHRLSRNSKWNANAAATALFATMTGAFLVSRYGFHTYDSTLALAGAVVTAFLYLALTRRLGQWFELLAAATWAFPFAWIPVRLGCVVEQAHGGVASDSWMALTFPDGVTRWDLALLEFLWAVFVAAALAVRPKLPAAIFVPATLALFRLAINPLRTGPPVYLSSAILGLWAFFVWLQRRRFDRMNA